MKPSVIADQPNLSASVNGYHRREKCKKVPTAFSFGYRVNNLAGFVVYPTIDHSLFILARRWNLRLLPDRCPHPCQRRMAMDFHLILENQSLLGIVSHRFFFKPIRSFLAFSYACSSRLPLRVCLGRCMEKPSWCRSLRN